MVLDVKYVEIYSPMTQIHLSSDECPTCKDVPSRHHARCCPEMKRPRHESGIDQRDRSDEYRRYHSREPKSEVADWRDQVPISSASSRDLRHDVYGPELDSRRRLTRHQRRIRPTIHEPEPPDGGSSVASARTSDSMRARPTKSRSRSRDGSEE